MSDNRFGGTGILALVGCVALFFLARRFFPGLANLLLIVGGILLALIVLLVVLVIYFSSKGNVKIADGSDISVHAEGRAHLMELRRLTVRIKDKYLHEHTASKEPDVPYPSSEIFSIKDWGSNSIIIGSNLWIDTQE